MIDNITEFMRSSSAGITFCLSSSLVELVQDSTRGGDPPRVLSCTSSTSDDERQNVMPAEDERMNSVMLSIIRRRTPSADVGDFDKQIYDLDMDSLDVVDLSQALEKEFGVEADLERVADCLTPSEIGSYFQELIGSP